MPFSLCDLPVLMNVVCVFRKDKGGRRGGGGGLGTAVGREEAKGRTGQGKEGDTKGQAEGREGRERTAGRGGRDKGKGKDTDAWETEGAATTTYNVHPLPPGGTM